MRRGWGGGGGGLGGGVSEEQEDSGQSQRLPPLQQWLGPLGERLERPLASRRRSAPQVQTCPAANRSFMGHRCQGCGQTGLRNTKTDKAFFPFPHEAPDLPHHPYAKEFSRMASAQPPNPPDFTKVTYTSLQIIHTHTECHPRALALEFSKLSPVGPSPPLHLRKSFAPILLPCAGFHLVQGSQMPATLHQPTSGSSGEPAVITAP